MGIQDRRSRSVSALVIACAALADAYASDTPYEVGVADLREPIIWGSECELPDGRRIAFGGQDQRAADGTPPTRVFADGQWHSLRAQLQADHPLQAAHEALATAQNRLTAHVAQTRYEYFQGLEPRTRPLDEVLGAVLAAQRQLPPAAGLPSSLQAARSAANVLLGEAVASLREADTRLERALLEQLEQADRALALARDLLGAEPPPRTLASFVYEPVAGVCVLFGGDHFDYLSNDLWVFDPQAERWSARLPGDGPRPRADHQAAVVDGELRIRGGYRYRDRFAYRQSPYAALADGEWAYDLAGDRWTALEADAERYAPLERHYRGEGFAPAYYWPDARPDREAHASRLAGLPPNTWVALGPSRRPQREQARRTWGTVVLDPARDLILQWGGGHQSHGGTDVLRYHLATNLWEQPDPIEYPLGQMYSSAQYPGGVSFNGRPWMIMHAYKSYAFSAELQQLVLTGRTRQWKFGHDPYFYRYDGAAAKWVERASLPEPLFGVQYFLKSYLVDTADGLINWGPKGLFVLDAQRLEWQRLPVRGRLPVAPADGGGLAYDPRRHQLLIAIKPWKPGGAGVFSGRLHAVDLRKGEVTELTPTGSEGVARLYLREPVYDPALDLVVWAHQTGQGTIAYDPAKDAWVRLAVDGELSFGFSTGHVYDARRRLHWAVDDEGAVHALRLDPQTLLIEPL